MSSYAASFLNAINTLIFLVSLVSFEITLGADGMFAAKASFGLVCFSLGAEQRAANTGQRQDGAQSPVSSLVVFRGRFQAPKS